VSSTIADPSSPPLADLPIDRLEDEIASLAAEVYALTCRWLCLVGEFERREGYVEWGCRSSSSWLAWRCGLSERAARDHVRVGRSLLELPRIREAFGRGELSYSKVRALTRAATPEDEVELLELARHATTDQLERIVRAYRGCLDLDDARRAHAERFLNWSWEPDGSLSFRGRLPAEEASLFMRSLEAARDELTEQGWEAGTREPAVTNADAAVLVAESYLANGPATRRAGERYQVVVRVDPETLTGESGSGRCATEDGSPLAAETARRIACDAGIVAIAEREGKVLGVGRKTRSVPPALRRALDARDGGCRFPGCNSRRFVEGHHLEHWADGGETSEENMVQLCRPHHRLIHEGGFSVARVGDRFVFRRPDGRVIAAVPCLGRRSTGGSAEPRRRRGEAHPLPRPARERMDLHWVVGTLMAQSGPRARARGPD
jgi:hypothetical protein